MSRTKTIRPTVVPVMLLVFILCLMAHWTSFAQTNSSVNDREVPAAAADAESAAIDKFRRALKLYRPLLRFDSGEDFFPLKADVITNNVGNRLVRDNDQPIAERLPGGRRLRIGYLHGGEKYPNGQDILGDDKIIERHQNKDDYFEDADNLQEDGRYRDRIYRRLVLTKDDDGRITGAWLQFWFFYYYNDFPIGIGGDHEGDWETALIKLDPNAIPVYAVYSQHGKGKKCVWNRVTHDNLRPVVFVALGSHANYFRTGNHGREGSNNGMDPRAMKGSITMGSNFPKWVNWPGFWGGTKGDVPVLDADSPKGPKKQRKMWDPEIFAGEAEVDEDCER